jgi:hypothetical protein
MSNLGDHRCNRTVSSGELLLSRILTSTKLPYHGRQSVEEKAVVWRILSAADERHDGELKGPQTMPISLLKWFSTSCYLGRVRHRLQFAKSVLACRTGLGVR